MTKKRATKKKLVTVVTPIGYLTTTPAIAAKVKAQARKSAKKTRRK